MKPNCDLPITREKYGPTHKGLGLGLLSCWPNTDCVEPASITDQSAVLIRPKRKRNNEIDALRCVATDQSAAAALIIRGRGRRDLIGKDRQRFDAERFRASMYANEPTYWRWGSCFIELWVGGVYASAKLVTPYWNADTDSVFIHLNFQQRDEFQDTYLRQLLALYTVDINKASGLKAD